MNGWNATMTLDVLPEAAAQEEADSFGKVAASFARMYAALLNCLPQRVADAILLQYTERVFAMMYEADE